jgi:mono/diheme cytochrome c family protein
VTVAGCGTDVSDHPGIHGITIAKKSPFYHAAYMFNQRCGGCHTFQYGGTEGSAVKPNNREYKDGPNFNVRKEQYQDVLYAIRNGGFSSGPMPQDILTGRDAQLVANFVSKYSGSLAKRPPSPVTNQGGGAPAGSQ